MDSFPVGPHRRVFLLIAVTYLLCHALLIVCVSIVYRTHPELVVSSGAATILYPVLLTGFGFALVLTSARSLHQRWYLAGGCAVILIVGVRYVVPPVGAVVTLAALVGVVLLPIVVFVTVGLRLVITRVPIERLTRVPRSPSIAPVLFVAGIVLLGIVGGALFAALTAPPAVPSEDWSSDRQLAYLAETDQTDRQTGAFIDSSRDYQRASRVLQLLATGQTETPTEFLDAAIVLQHGTCPAHFELAHRLAVVAHDANVENAAQWRRLTYDRWQLSVGNAQRYGTQSGTVQVNATCVPSLPPELDISELVKRTENTG